MVNGGGWSGRVLIIVAADGCSLIAAADADAAAAAAAFKWSMV